MDIFKVYEINKNERGAYVIAETHISPKGCKLPAERRRRKPID